MSKKMESAELTNALTQQVEKIVSIVKVNFQRLDESELNWKENPERWSILECLEHLNRYCRFYNPQILVKSDAVLKKGAGTATIKSTWVGKKFIAMMHPDNLKKQKTFARMNPQNSKLTKAVVNEFLKHQNDLLDVLKILSPADLNTGKVPVEFFKLLKLNLGDALQFVIVHEQRHINQGLAVLATLQKQKPTLII